MQPSMRIERKVNRIPKEVFRNALKLRNPDDMQKFLELTTSPHLADKADLHATFTEIVAGRVERIRAVGLDPSEYHVIDLPHDIFLSELDQLLVSFLALVRFPTVRSIYNMFVTRLKSTAHYNGMYERTVAWTEQLLTTMKSELTRMRKSGVLSASAPAPVPAPVPVETKDDSKEREAKLRLEKEAEEKRRKQMEEDKKEAEAKSELKQVLNPSKPESSINSMQINETVPLDWDSLLLVFSSKYNPPDGCLTADTILPYIKDHEEYEGYMRPLTTQMNEWFSNRERRLAQLHSSAFDEPLGSSKYPNVNDEGLLDSLRTTHAESCIMLDEFLGFWTIHPHMSAVVTPLYDDLFLLMQSQPTNSGEISKRLETLVEVVNLTLKQDTILFEDLIRLSTRFMQDWMTIVDKYSPNWKDSQMDEVAKLMNTRITQLIDGLTEMTKVRASTDEKMFTPLFSVEWYLAGDLLQEIYEMARKLAVNIRLNQLFEEKYPNIRALRARMLILDGFYRAEEYPKHILSDYNTYRLYYRNLHTEVGRAFETLLAAFDFDAWPSPLATDKTLWSKLAPYDPEQVYKLDQSWLRSLNPNVRVQSAQTPAHDSPPATSTVNDPSVDAKLVEEKKRLYEENERMRKLAEEEAERKKKKEDEEATLVARRIAAEQEERNRQEAAMQKLKEEAAEKERRAEEKRRKEEEAKRAQEMREAIANAEKQAAEQKTREEQAARLKQEQEENRKREEREKQEKEKKERDAQLEAKRAEDERRKKKLEEQRKKDAEAKERMEAEKKRLAELEAQRRETEEAKKKKEEEEEKKGRQEPADSTVRPVSTKASDELRKTDPAMATEVDNVVAQVLGQMDELRTMFRAEIFIGRMDYTIDGISKPARNNQRTRDSIEQWFAVRSKQIDPDPKPNTPEEVKTLTLRAIYWEQLVYSTRDQVNERIAQEAINIRVKAANPPEQPSDQTSPGQGEGQFTVMESIAMIGSRLKKNTQQSVSSVVSNATESIAMIGSRLKKNTQQSVSSVVSNATAKFTETKQNIASYFSRTFGGNPLAPRPAKPPPDSSSDADAQDSSLVSVKAQLEKPVIDREKVRRLKTSHKSTTPSGVVTTNLADSTSTVTAETEMKPSTSVPDSPAPVPLDITKVTKQLDGFKLKETKAERKQRKLKEFNEDMDRIILHHMNNVYGEGNYTLEQENDARAYFGVRLKPTKPPAELFIVEEDGEDSAE